MLIFRHLFILLSHSQVCVRGPIRFRLEIYYARRNSYSRAE